MTTAGREVPPSDFRRGWRLCEKKTRKYWKRRRRTRRMKVGRKRKRERERESGREREERREVEAENLIGRDACERRKETVDQTSRASEASVWN